MFILLMLVSSCASVAFGQNNTQSFSCYTCNSAHDPKCLNDNELDDTYLEACSEFGLCRMTVTRSKEGTLVSVVRSCTTYSEMNTVMQAANSMTSGGNYEELLHYDSQNEQVVSDRFCSSGQCTITEPNYVLCNKCDRNTIVTRTLSSVNISGLEGMIMGDESPCTHHACVGDSCLQFKQTIKVIGNGELEVHSTSDMCPHQHLNYSVGCHPYETEGEADISMAIEEFKIANDTLDIHIDMEMCKCTGDLCTHEPETTSVASTVRANTTTKDSGENGAAEITFEAWMIVPLLSLHLYLFYMEFN